MELTCSFLDLLQHFAPVFTAPTYQTFVVIVCGWVPDDEIIALMSPGSVPPTE